MPYIPITYRQIYAVRSPLFIDPLLYLSVVDRNSQMRIYRLFGRNLKYVETTGGSMAWYYEQIGAYSAMSEPSKNAQWLGGLLSEEAANKFLALLATGNLDDYDLAMLILGAK